MEQEFKISEIKKNILESPYKPAFIPFVVGGYPNLEITKEILYCLRENNAAAIELGIPFSDPLADGPVIQEAAKIAIDNGANINKIFSLLEDVKSDSTFTTPIILFTYYNLIVNYGVQNFIKKSAQVGVSGFIVPDLPFEESEDFNKYCKEFGLDQILLVAPTSGSDRIKTIAQSSSGFIYVVSSTGVTGVRDSFSDILSEVVSEIKKVTDTPSAVGFGVSKPEHINALKELKADGAIIGSAIIKLIKENQGNQLTQKLTEYIKTLYSVQ